MPYSYKEDLTGKHFGRLTVIGWDRDRSFISNQNYWWCRCDCGNEILVMQQHLKSGHTTSCGCYRREVTREMSLKPNRYEFMNDGSVMMFANNTGKSFLIDAIDFEHVRKIGWFETPDGYLMGNFNGRNVYLHRFIMQEELKNNPDALIDHIDTLKRWDNRRSNLRLTDSTGNAQNKQKQSNNTSGIPGVSWYKQSKKWLVRINGSHIGYFSDKYKAFCVSRDLHAWLFGEFNPQIWDKIEQEEFPEEWAKKQMGKEVLTHENYPM